MCLTPFLGEMEIRQGWCYCLATPISKPFRRRTVLAVSHRIRNQGRISRGSNKLGTLNGFDSPKKIEARGS